MSVSTFAKSISHRRTDTILLTPLETDAAIRASATPSSIASAITRTSSWGRDKDGNNFLQRRTTLQVILDDYCGGDPDANRRELARIEKEAQEIHTRLVALNVHLNFSHRADPCGGSGPFEQMLAEIEKEKEAAKKSKLGKCIERITKFFDNVYKMKDVIDTLVSSNPEYAALVWGSVKFLMMGFMNRHEIKQKISEKIVEITMQFPSLKRKESLFPTAPFKIAVKSLSLSFMEFLVKALEWTRKPRGIKKAMASVFEDFNIVFDESLLKISHYTRMVDISLKDMTLLEQRHQSLQMANVDKNVASMIPQLSELTAVIPLVKELREEFNTLKSLSLASAREGTNTNDSGNTALDILSKSPNLTNAAAYDIRLSYLHSMAADDLSNAEHHCTCRYKLFSAPTSTNIASILELPPALCPLTKIAEVSAHLRKKNYQRIWRKLPNLRPLAIWTRNIIAICLPRQNHSYIALASLMTTWHAHCAATARTRQHHRRVALVHFFPPNLSLSDPESNEWCKNLSKSLLLQLIKELPDIPARASERYQKQLADCHHSVKAIWDVILETVGYISPDVEIYILLNLLPADFLLLKDANVVVEALGKLCGTAVTGVAGRGGKQQSISRTRAGRASSDIFSKKMYATKRRTGPKVRLLVSTVSSPKSIPSIFTGVEVELVQSGLLNPPLGGGSGMMGMVASKQKKRPTTTGEYVSKQRKKMAQIYMMEKARASIY